MGSPLQDNVISLLSKSDAEGQSRTDTGSPPPAFESGATYISSCFIILTHVWVWKFC